MRLPDFLLIGAAKSGTISLYHYLRQHPDIFMCPINECNFFALETADWTANYQGPVDRLYLDRHCIKTLDAYQNLFNAAASNQAVGESSPLYLFSQAAPARIRHYIPNPRIIVILRQPAERAFSNYQALRRGGIEPLADFREAIQAEGVRHAEGWGPWPFWYYAEMGFYARQLRNYLAVFGREQILVRLYEDLQKDPVGLMKDIYEFIGVDNGFTPDVSTRHNLGGVPRRDWLHRLILKPGPGKALLKKVIPDKVRHRLRDRIADWNTDKARPDPYFLAELNRIYEKDIMALQGLIDRDLSHWL